MLLLDLLKGVDYLFTAGNPRILGMQYDSRKIRPGELFFAIPGYKQDGHDFVLEAKSKGASAVIVTKEVPGLNLPFVKVVDSRLAMAQIATNFYQNPASKMRVIGVTGTNGKTTTTYLIKAILEEAGFRVGLLGTIENFVSDIPSPALRTTPESLDLQHQLSAMIQHQRDYAVMEVSSHALVLSRTDGVEFDVGCFTNLSPEHLDFHKTLAEYVEAKSRLFLGLKKGQKGRKLGIVNLDDKEGLKIASRSAAPLLGYGIHTPAQVQARDIHVGNEGVEFLLVTPLGCLPFRLAIHGRFNIYNALCAISVGIGEGIPLEVIQAGIEKVRGVPGRFESVAQGQDFTVIVDYAHTPDGLENVLKTAREITKGSLYVVFGAGGDRDKTKRPLMGEVAARYADYSIVTSDNPRSEDPEAICAEILQGFPRDTPFEVEVRRCEAIKKGIQRAKKGDMLLIAGKGHEDYQEIQGETRYFSDRDEVKKALKEFCL